MGIEPTTYWLPLSHLEITFTQRNTIVRGNQYVPLLCAAANGAKFLAYWTASAWPHDPRSTYSMKRSRCNLNSSELLCWRNSSRFVSAHLPTSSTSAAKFSSLHHLSASERLSYLHCFLSTTKYSSKSLHSPIRSWQPVNHLISTISSNYTSHHELSVLQPSNYSKYHICLQILVGTPSATALLQHGIPFLPPSKIVRPYIVSSVT